MINLLLWLSGNLWRTQEAYPYFLSVGNNDYTARQFAKDISKEGMKIIRTNEKYKMFIKSKYNVYNIK